MLFGDSITAGQYMRPRYRWPSIFGRGLEADFPGSYDVDVRAISGETSRQALLRFPQALAESPVDDLFIQFGFNDANFWESEGGLHPRVSLSSFKANLEEMVERGKQQGVQNIVIATNHTVLKQMSNGLSLQESKIRYDEVSREVAREQDCKCFDIALLLKEYKSSEIKEFLLAKPDQLHLSQLGHAFYAKVFLDFWRSLVLAAK